MENMENWKIEELKNYEKSWNFSRETAEPLIFCGVLNDSDANISTIDTNMEIFTFALNAKFKDYFKIAPPHSMLNHCCLN